MNQAGTAGGQSAVGYFSQARESRRCHSAQLFLLQLYQDSSYTSHVPSHGRWRHRSALERRGFGCPLGSLLTAEGGKSSVNDRSSHMAMGRIRHIRHSLSGCFPSVVARTYFPNHIRDTRVSAKAEKTRFKVAHYQGNQFTQNSLPPKYNPS